MNFIGSNYGTCGCKCQTMPTFQQCNQVVYTCNVEEVPHFIDYHTHIVNNHIAKHVNIPTYSTSEENVLINEYPQAQMMSPFMAYPQQMCGVQMDSQMEQYQGNVGINPSPIQNPYSVPQYQGMNMPFNS